MFIQPLISRPRARTELTVKRTFRKLLVPSKIELIYAPYLLFEAVGQDSDANNELFALDLLDGDIAYFSENAPNAASPESAIALPPLLDENEVIEKARKAFSRITHQASLRRGADIGFRSLQKRERFFYPYWAGYFEVKKNVEIRCIDAINGARVGPQMKAAIVRALVVMDKRKDASG